MRFGLILLLITYVSCSSNIASEQVDNSDTETIYFPPIASDTWDTKSFAELNWNEENLQPLLNYLEEKHSKSFMILHNGKRVVEAYFDGHTSSSSWYWASAGKTLTSTLTGIAQHEGLLNINHKVSDYIGQGWTTAPQGKEDLITCKHLLSMTSGLDDTLGDSVVPQNLHYVADAGNRWAYHNVYVKLQEVVAQASSQSWSSYFNDKLKNPIGMTGIWIQNNHNRLYWSTTRSMARFGLLVYAGGLWENTQIIPSNFLNNAINTSQNINLAYGYMWWLNGKSSFMIPQGQFVLSGHIIPNAPSDMYCALGKNDQKLYIVPSKKLVVVRMGNAADGEIFALSDFDDELWSHINALF